MIKLIFISFILLFVTIIVYFYFVITNEIYRSNIFEKETRATCWIGIGLYIITQTLILINEFDIISFGLFINCLLIVYILYQEEKSN